MNLDTVFNLANPNQEWRPSGVHPNAYWTDSFEIQLDDDAGVVFSAYGQANKTSGSRLFDLSVSSAPSAITGNHTITVSGTEAQTLAAFGLKRVLIVVTATHSSKRYVIASGFAEVENSAITDTAIAVDNGLSASETALIESVVNGMDIEGGAMSDASVETAYNNQVSLSSQAEAEAGTESAVRRFSPLRIAQAITAKISALTLNSFTNDAGFISDYSVTEADVKAALDGATLSDIGTPTSSDKILIQDDSDSDNLKSVAFSEFGGGGGVDWSTVQTSTQTDGASNVAFEFELPSGWSLGKGLNVKDNGGVDRFSVMPDGDVYGYDRFYPSINRGSTRNAAIFSLSDGSMVVETANGNFSLGNSSYGDVAIHEAGYFIGRSTADGGYYTFEIDGETSDKATTGFKFKAQDAATSATVNQDGAGFEFEMGDSASGGGSNGNFVITNLPTSDPTVSGALWNDSGTLKISAG